MGGFRGAKISRKAMAAGRARQAERAAALARDLAEVVAAIRTAGASSLREIAAGLTERDIPTPRGAGAWSAMQVSRVLARIAV